MYPENLTGQDEVDNLTRATVEYFVPKKPASMVDVDRSITLASEQQIGVPARDERTYAMACRSNEVLVGKTRGKLCRNTPA